MSLPLSVCPCWWGQQDMALDTGDGLGRTELLLGCDQHSLQQQGWQMGYKPFLSGVCQPALLLLLLCQGAVALQGAAVLQLEAHGLASNWPWAEPARETPGTLWDVLRCQLGLSLLNHHSLLSFLFLIHFSSHLTVTQVLSVTLPQLETALKLSQKC